MNFIPSYWRNSYILHSVVIIYSPLNLRSLIWLLMIDWSKRGNINTAALVTTVQYSAKLLLHDVLGSLHCHTGTFTLWLAYRWLPTVHSGVVLVRWKPISVANWIPSVLWRYWLGHLTCKNRPRNDLQSVEWDVSSNRTPILRQECVVCGPGQ